ncbi:MAG: HU family DNA-binding protein [Planctomycetota bacterium]
MAKKKTTRRKTTTKKKTTRKKATTTSRKKSTTRKKTTRRTAAADKPRTKSQIYTAISEETGLTRREIGEVFESMSAIIKKDLGRSGPGAFTVPGLMKIVKQHKPRRAARKGINPFTGEEQMFKAKPAHNVVKIRALKNLKEMV